jgi:hypothetical protein
METGLTPREIQAKIRAGASIAEVAAATDIAQPRVEAFAVPVLAEREHIADQARKASIRRNGTPIAHQTLDETLTNRLREFDAEPESASWDAFKMDDGRWSVTIDYRQPQGEHRAVFHYDVRGRFVVAGNDEAQSVTGELSADGEQSDAAADLTGDEPTVRLVGAEDELALIRAVETDQDTGPQRSDQTVRAKDDAADVSAADADSARADESGSATPAADQTQQDQTQLGLLYDMLGGATKSSPKSSGARKRGSTRKQATDTTAHSDAAAIPEPPGGAELAEEAWDQPTAYPAEPAPEPDQPDLLTAAETEPAEGSAAAAKDTTANGAESAGQQPSAKQARSKKRKRASVPSWDEIMFGAPKDE